MMQQGNMTSRLLLFICMIWRDLLPFLFARAAALFGAAPEPVSLIYDERLEDASDFDLSSYYHRVENAVAYVIMKELKLQKFVLNTSFYYKLKSRVTELIRYALISKVEELNLSFWYDFGPPVEIVLDESFFNNSHLTHLKLSFNFPKPTHKICWQNLKSLSLSNLRLTEDFFQEILSGSPVLETFKLDNCFGDFWDLIINSDSVKTFEISGNRKFRVGSPCVKLEAPNILSLTMKGSFVLRALQVFNVSSLVVANLDYYDEDDTGYDLSTDDEEEMIYRHVKILRLAGVKELNLGPICLEVLSCLEAKGTCTDDYYKDQYDGYIEDWRMSRMGYEYDEDL